MKNTRLAAGGLALFLAIAAPAFAQTNPSATVQPDTTTTATTTTATPMSEKDQAALKKCKALTEAQRAQSSKCTKLMKDAGIVTAPSDPLSDAGYR